MILPEVNWRHCYLKVTSSRYVIYSAYQEHTHVRALCFDKNAKMVRKKKKPLFVRTCQLVSYAGFRPIYKDLWNHNAMNKLSWLQFISHFKHILSHSHSAMHMLSVYENNYLQTILLNTLWILLISILLNFQYDICTKQYHMLDVSVDETVIWAQSQENWVLSYANIMKEDQLTYLHNTIYTSTVRLVESKYHKCLLYSNLHEFS